MMRIAALVFLAAAALASAASAAPFPGQKEGDYTIAGFKFESGETLASLRMHYTTLGTLKRDSHGHAANAILIMHGTGGSGAQFFRPQFADVLFKPGGILDPAKYFIILPDDIGHGKSSKPSDGLRAHFPHYGYRDMVRAEYLLVTKGLGADRLRVVMGTSMGCMHAFLWGELYPKAMDGLMPLACEPVQIAGRNRLWRDMIIDGIESDPAWKRGDYLEEPMMGLRLAADILRIAGSAPLQDQKALPAPDAADAALKTYLDGELAHLDANDLDYQVASSRDYDPSADLGKIEARVMWVNSGDDFINPRELKISEAMVKKIPHAQFVLIPASLQTHGHGSHTWAVLWQDKLAQLLADTAH